MGLFKRLFFAEVFHHWYHIDDEGEAGGTVDEPQQQERQQAMSEE